MKTNSKKTYKTEYQILNDLLLPHNLISVVNMTDTFISVIDKKTKQKVFIIPKPVIIKDKEELISIFKKHIDNYTSNLTLPSTKKQYTYDDIPDKSKEGMDKELELSLIHI
jgi:hypothetical protein